MKTVCFIKNSFLFILLFLFIQGYSQEMKSCSTDLQLYPETYNSVPDLSSPCFLPNGTEIVVAQMKENEFTIIPITVENGETRDYPKGKWGKGNQLKVDSVDFPLLAATGLHAIKELKNVKTIGGKPIQQISKEGQPGVASSEGFLAEGEDIISVINADNTVVKELNLTHPQLAKPLFNVFNLILEHRKEYVKDRRVFEEFDYIIYNGHKIYAEWGGAKGWQNSIFNDNNPGYYWIKIRRELTGEEIDYMKDKYRNLPQPEFEALKTKLSEINTGEMVPYYIMLYGFYEGHTSWRADPVSISFVFSLKTLAEIEKALQSNLLLYFGD